VLILLLVLVLGMYLLMRSRFNPIAKDLAMTQVMNQTSDLINDAIAEQIARDNIQYDRIIYFEKDLNGRITALKTNMSEVNRLKTDILNIINDEILALDTHDIGIPLGSLFLPELLSGKGPVLPVRVISISNYIIQKRVEEAKKLLTQSSLPINTVSLYVGYSNFSYFTKMFKDNTGYAPLEYRRSFGER